MEILLMEGKSGQSEQAEISRHEVGIPLVGRKAAKVQG
jgi:hypothetical protein